MKLKLRTGDKVLIRCGKDRGENGKIQRVIDAKTDKPRVIVEGLNMCRKHVKPNQSLPQGGILEKEQPIIPSKLMLICPACGQPARVGRKNLADGKHARYCKKCGELIDKL